VPGFPVAGKTGTAQKAEVGGRGYIKGAYLSSFVGYLPANDPRFVIYIAVDHPRREFYGSAVAAPVFSRVAQFAVSRAGLEPVLLRETEVSAPLSLADRRAESRNKELTRTTGEVSADGQGSRGAGVSTDQRAKLNTASSDSEQKARLNTSTRKDGSPSEGPQAKSVAQAPEINSEQVQPTDNSPAKVPSVLGRTAREAMRAAPRLQWQFSGYGVILEIEPAPGTPLEPGQTVRATLGEKSL
jgi:membrane peptidoglycan carboxypeptidase